MKTAMKDIKGWKVFVQAENRQRSTRVSKELTRHSKTTGNQKYKHQKPHSQFKASAELTLAELLLLLLHFRTIWNSDQPEI